MFPKFANVPISELPTNSDFLLQAYTCISSVNSIAKYYDRSTGCAEGCPVLSGLSKKYKAVDFKVLLLYIQLVCWNINHLLIFLYIIFLY